MNSTFRKCLAYLTATIYVCLVVSCSSGDSDRGKKQLVQNGSSTLYPVAKVWRDQFSDSTIDLKSSGSTEGLYALLKGEANLANTSRPIKGEDYEKMGCPATLVNEDGTANKPCGDVFPKRWVVAYDVLTVVIHPENTWVKKLTFDQLYQIFTNDNPAEYWDEVSGLENAPHEKIVIYAPDEASGSYDFFFEKIIPRKGEEKRAAGSRLELKDGVYHPSSDDRVILTAIRSNPYSIGFLGYAYYSILPGRVTAVLIADKGRVFFPPETENPEDYPLFRPLFIYTNGIPADGSLVNKYMSFVLSDEGQYIVERVGYVKVSDVNPDLLKEERDLLSNKLLTIQEDPGLLN